MNEGRVPGEIPAAPGDEAAGPLPPPPVPPVPPTGAPGAWAGSQGPANGGGWQGGTAGSPPEWGGQSPAAPVGWGPPRRSGNGCLQACLIVGGLGVLVAVVLLVAGVLFLRPIFEQIERDPEGAFGHPCPLVDDGDLSDRLGEPVQARTLEGLADSTMGAVLDKRLLPDATDCYLVGSRGLAARIAVVDGNGAATFAEARGAAIGFRGADLADFGDEAFCTERSAAGSTGVLVRFGNRVVYASVAERGRGSGDGCALARQVAEAAGP
jgi:hypothetical protein